MTRTGEFFDMPEKPFTFETTDTWWSALDEARRLKHREIDTGHILLALISEKAGIFDRIFMALNMLPSTHISEKNGPAFQSLANAGATMSLARKYLKEIVGEGDKPHKIDRLIGEVSRTERPLSSQTKELAKNAAEWSEKLGKTKIKNEHLLLGLLDVKNCVGINLLRRMGINPNVLRDSLLSAIKKPDQPIN